MHPLSGTVLYRKEDPSVIVVSNFTYRKPGSDTFFWVGKRRVAGGCNVDNIASDSYSLAPGEKGNNDYTDSAKPILPAFDGTQADILLKLPEGITIRDLKWICIWSRKFSKNFAQINIDDGVGTSIDGVTKDKKNPWRVHLILHKTFEVDNQTSKKKTFGLEQNTESHREKDQSRNHATQGIHNHVLTFSNIQIEKSFSRLKKKKINHSYYEVIKKFVW